MRDKSLRSGERQVAQTLQGVEEWHRWRYLETLKYIEGKDVLDVGCGVGYGSYIMAENAKSVFGLDDSQEAIDQAWEYFVGGNINYYCCDFLKVKIEALSTQNALVAFEVIEHIQDTEPVFKKFKELDPELIIISTPHRITPMGGNEFHFGLEKVLNSG